METLCNADAFYKAFIPEYERVYTIPLAQTVKNCVGKMNEGKTFDWAIADVRE